MRAQAYRRSTWTTLALLGLLGCDEKKDAPAAVGQALSASASAAGVASANLPGKTAEASPGGCAATGTQPTQIGTVVGDVYGFSSDATHLYYTTWQLYGSRGDVGKIRKDGKGSKGLASLELEPRGLAVDANKLFFTSGIRLISMPKDGGMTVTMAPQFSSQSIALDALNVFGVPGDYGPYDRVAKIDKDGGESKELATAKRPAVSDGPKGYTSMAVDASGIYVADAGNKRVLRFALTGGSPKVLATLPKRPYDLVVDDSSVYFSVAEGELMMVSKGGGGTTKLATALVEKSRIAGDAAGVFSTLAAKAGEPSKVFKVVPKEGKPTPVASVPESQSVEAIAADERCVYWVQRADAARGTVYALPR